MYILLLQKEGTAQAHAFRSKSFRKPQPCHWCHQPVQQGVCCRGNFSKIVRRSCGLSFNNYLFHSHHWITDLHKCIDFQFNLFNSLAIGWDRRTFRNFSDSVRYLFFFASYDLILVKNYSSGKRWYACARVLLYV